jgi:DNA recombination protein RmuC
MDPILVGLVANLVLQIAIICVLIFRSRSSIGSSELDASIRKELRTSGVELRQDLATQRTETAQQFSDEREERRTAHRDLRQDVESMREGNETKLERIRETLDSKLQETVTALTQNSDRMQSLIRENAEKHIELQAVLRDELEKLRLGNESKLEKMRETVDEKLQGTLEKRLGESFSLVSARLEEVQKGLGEMQTLASDVGGLKRVLTNVKSRGGWGEVQLARQLEDILTADQYEQNVMIKPGSNERVEFAVRLPGRDDIGTVVYLPIDSKFPQEDYERLIDAQERGEKSEADEAMRGLERVIVEQAKLIALKYISPPHSTDFAIMYLPTEGLFAEVIRRPGLASKIQNDHRVIITGPTTLMSILNSLQVGFRTLVIEKRSSEVWRVLGAAKTEFQKYGQVWAKLEKQLQTAQNTVGEASRRTRAVERNLRAVESMEPPAIGSELVEEVLDSIEDIALDVSGPQNDDE